MEDQPVSDDALSSARELFEAGQYAGVVAVCCQALDQRPGDAAMLRERARAWIALDRSTQAINDLREVISIDPRCSGAHRALGRLLMHRGELEAARRALADALELDRGDRELREQLEAIDAALVVEGALALEDALASEDALARAAALAREDALEEEAFDLEAALAGESADSLEAVPADRGEAKVLELPRLTTQPMARAASSAAGWRAPTMPLVRDGARAIARVAPVVPMDRGAPGNSRRAPTTPMARTPGSAAAWRAPTLPVRRSPALTAMAAPELPEAPKAPEAPGDAPPPWLERQEVSARGTGSGRAFDERHAAEDRRLAEQRLAAEDRRAADELVAPTRRAVTRALIRRVPAPPPLVRSVGLGRATTVPFHRGRAPTAPLYSQTAPPPPLAAPEGEAAGEPSLEADVLTRYRAGTVPMPRDRR